MLDQRILNRCSGYWPRTPIVQPELQAWAHLLGDLDPERVLVAIDAYAKRGNTLPPLAGQIAKAVEDAGGFTMFPCTLIDAEPEVEAHFRREISSDVWDIWISQCWLAVRESDGALVFGGTARAISWTELRYGRVLARIADANGYPGIVLVVAPKPVQTTTELRAA